MVDVKSSAEYSLGYGCLFCSASIKHLVSRDISKYVEILDSKDDYITFRGNIPSAMLLAIMYSYGVIDFYYRSTLENKIAVMENASLSEYNTHTEDGYEIARTYEQGVLSLSSDIKCFLFGIDVVSNYGLSHNYR